MSLISWERICRPKCYGRLDFKNLDVMNQALLMKIGQNLVVNPKSLWSQALLTKYFVNHENLPHELPTRCGSYLWKSIRRIWNDVKRGIWWNVGDGKTVRFQWDCWVIKNQPLINYAIAPVPNYLVNKKTIDFVDNASNWLWESFSFLLPHNILMTK